MQKMTTKKRWIGRVAHLLRRFPWLGTLIQRVMRLVQPHFTAGAVGVLLDESQTRVLLVEHVFHTRTPWGLPGGWMDRGEDPAQTVEREFYEETGLKVRAVQPLLIQRSRLHGHMDIAFYCVLDAGAGYDSQAIRLSGELISWDWVALDDLPPLAAYTRQTIQTAQALAARGALPTGKDDFDLVNS
ncbi:MAG: NUDIX hydrolase [Anaerolineae bacterium]|nr:NUDIX hydrolase [Anaerolineae bacterium]